MPFLFLERFPWPSLQTYTALSAALLAGTVLTVCSSDSRPQSSSEETHGHPVHGSRISRYIRDGGQYLSAGYGDVAADVLLYLLTDSVFVWVSVYMNTVGRCGWELTCSMATLTLMKPQIK